MDTTKIKDAAFSYGIPAIAGVGGFALGHKLTPIKFGKFKIGFGLAGAVALAGIAMWLVPMAMKSMTPDMAPATKPGEAKNEQTKATSNFSSNVEADLGFAGQPKYTTVGRISKRQCAMMGGTWTQDNATQTEYCSNSKL